MGKAMIRGMAAEISSKVGRRTYTIAHVAEIDGGRVDEANGLLMAAAPKMKDALIAMRRARDTAIVDDEFPARIALADRLLREALAAAGVK